MLELYLVRHGETESNIKKRYQGWTESILTEKGLLQAERVGQFLAHKKISALYASDLSRAAHTAQVIGSHSVLKPEINPLLREINFGHWEGLTFDEIKATWPQEVTLWMDNPFRRSAPAGETIVEVGERMQLFVKNLSRLYPDGLRVAAVSHGGSIRALLHSIMNLNKQTFWEIAIENASVSLVRLKGGRQAVEYYNHTEHLSSL